MAAVYPVASPFNTNPSYSGSFIPTIWSAKMNAKFYATTVFGDIANTDWQGEVSGMGDKVVINTPPDVTVSNYVPGTGLTYPVPVPSSQELLIDKGKYFAFQVNDVLAYQSKPDLIDTFSADAAQRMRIAIDSDVLYRAFGQSATKNKGANAGVKSGKYNLGTDANPFELTASNVLEKILHMASVMDEQNLPDDSRWLLIDPYTRSLLMQSNLAQANFMGDNTSIVRNGLIGTIDRFKVYVTNQLPKAVAGSGTPTPWVSGDGTDNSITSASDLARRVILAGHKSALTFASQITKMETVRNQDDFGDFIRSLNVYGSKVVQPDALVTLIAK